MSWNDRTLPAEIERDMQDAARRRGAPLPPSAPAIRVERPHSHGATSCVRLPAKRRIVSPAGER